MHIIPEQSIDDFLKAHNVIHPYIFKKCSRKKRDNAFTAPTKKKKLL